MNQQHEFLRFRPRSRFVALWLLVVILGLAACGDDDATPDETPAAPTLDDTSWTVSGTTVDGITLSAVDGQPATMTIANSVVRGSTGCNTYDAGISIDPQGVVAIRNLEFTEIACDPRIMDFEAAFLTALASIERFHLDGDNLRLANADDTTTIGLIAAPASQS